ncbi:hypothetical protein EG347_14735 [Chryseobacterium sp. G0186]|uniref:hypothetical protein n=1 Tax=Chryseobacterium sp. G0186 TaxID=2487064 RepID=UPI000F4EEB16|nr:hypothetical protein [Chryseobacterium sp. G0186]AZA78673.1 hypothetical protein EG347_14735 [Chryseobacterium sp. G0186]
MAFDDEQTQIVLAVRDVSQGIPELSIEANGLKEAEELVENVITWIFEENSFVPCTKIVGAEQYSK